MWLPLTLLVLAGVACAEFEYAWKVGNEYTYVVQSRTLTNLDQFPTQYAGILTKGLLTIQVKETSTIIAKLWQCQYAHINLNLTNGWDAEIPSTELEYRDLPISQKPFEIKMNEGWLKSVIVEEDVPNWEVVLLKSIISKLQVDTMGRELVSGEEVKIPDVSNPRGRFTVLEDDFAGSCEVRYDFKPLSEQQIQTKPELVPKPELKDGHHIDVIKTKNYDKYAQMSVFGMTRQLSELRNEKQLLSKTSTSRIVISGNLKDFIIQSSVTTSKMAISPKFQDPTNDTVISKLNLTLDNVNQISNPMPSPKNPKNTGYQIPFERTSSPLENAPNHPVWPNIIDFKGKFIGKSGEVDGLTAVKELVSQIANELENPNTIPTLNTLDKFTVLVNLIRSMNRDQIAEAERSMDISPKKLKWDDEAETVKQNAWSVFRDAVTQSGTGPSLLTIKNWIENESIKSMDAAEILSKIPATVRHITENYTEAFFELVTSPQVAQTPLLNITALTAFSQLLFQSQLNDKSIYKFYPAHTNGRASDAQYANIVTKYIPYLAMQLKKAVDDGDSPRIQTYIVALGNIGMLEALPPLEPYLTGTEKLTAFQKTLMLASLSNFVANHPKKALPGLTQIYMNTTESHEVRCMAVFLLPMTNPSLEVLREIVEFSNKDNNKQVNSAVKSTLQNLADLTDPEWQPLAENARAAMKLMNKNNDGILKSREFILNRRFEENIVSNTIFNYIGNDDGPIPRTVYLASILYHGNFKGTPMEFMAMIPNIDSLLDALIPSDKQPLVKMATEKIAEELNIVGDKPVELEGNFMWRTKFFSQFLPYDENTIRNIPNKIAEHIAAKKDGGYHNTNILNLNEMTIGDTTDTGLPFVYSRRECTLLKLNSIDHYKPGRIKSEFKLVLGHKLQRNVGFVTPFDHRHFAAGVDKYTQIFVPLNISLEVSAPENSMQLMVAPLKSDDACWVARRVVTPYTSIHNVMDIQPLLNQDSTQYLHIDELKSLQMPVPFSRFRMMLEADESNEDIWTADVRTGWSMFPFIEENSIYHNLALIMDVNPDEEEPIILTASYGTLDVEPGTEDANQWTQFANVVETSSENRNSKQRKTQFLKEAAKGIQLAQSWVLDCQLQVPDGEDVSRTNVTVAWSVSNVETKGRLLLRLSAESPLNDVKAELCAASQLALTPSYFPVYEEVTNSTPKVEFDAQIRYGVNCPKSKNINIMGTATRSKELKEEIEKTSIVKECKKQMEQGNKLLRACQNAGARALQMDELEITLKTDSSDINDVAEESLTGLATYVDRDVIVSEPVNTDSNKITIKAKLSKDIKSANFTMNLLNSKMEMNDVDLDVLQDSSEETEDDDDDWASDDDTSTCVMDLNRAETFDGKEFPLKLTSCWQVLMTTYPKSNPKKPNEKLPMSEDDSVSILAREVNGQKEVKVILGRNEILLLPGSQLPEVVVNGQKVQVSRAVSHQVRQDDEVVFEIFQRGSHYVSVVSDSFDIDLTYDGKRVMIEEPDMYSNSIRGLCGNHDGDSQNDFMSPGNCLLRVPEEFIASYTLTKDQCEGDNLQKVKSLQKSVCTTISRR